MLRPAWHGAFMLFLHYLEEDGDISYEEGTDSEEDDDSQDGEDEHGEEEDVEDESDRKDMSLSVPGFCILS